MCLCITIKHFGNIHTHLTYTSNRYHALLCAYYLFHWIQTAEQHNMGNYFITAVLISPEEKDLTRGYSLLFSLHATQQLRQ